MKLTALTLWAIAIVTVVLSIAMVLLGGGCAVYDMPCSLAREHDDDADGVTVCVEPEPECTCDGGVR